MKFKPGEDLNPVEVFGNGRMFSADQADSVETSVWLHLAESSLDPLVDVINPVNVMISSEITAL